MDVLDTLTASAGALTAIGGIALVLRAAWLLPDWLGKWQQLIDARRGRAEPHRQTGPDQDATNQSDAREA